LFGHTVYWRGRSLKLDAEGRIHRGPGQGPGI
jgi:hypothetical protein